MTHHQFLIYIFSCLWIKPIYWKDVAKKKFSRDDFFSSRNFFLSQLKLGFGLMTPEKRALMAALPVGIE